jgi:hypothetical protein
MRVVGIDQSNTSTGVALLDAPGGRPALLDLRAVHGWGAARASDTAARVLEIVTPWCDPATEVRCELAPPTAREETHHGRQAEIGWGLGYLGGLIVGALLFRPDGPSVACVPVSEWRTRMLELSTRWGVFAEAPALRPPSIGAQPPTRRQVERDGDGFLLHWEGCEHRTPLLDFAALQASTLTRCPTCAGAANAAAADPAEWRRQEWKRLACRLVSIHWPDPYRALVADARSRARSEKQDHELSGVADACEAVWIGLSAWRM